MSSYVAVCNVHDSRKPRNSKTKTKSTGKDIQHHKPEQQQNCPELVDPMTLSQKTRWAYTSNHEQNTIRYCTADNGLSTDAIQPELTKIPIIRIIISYMCILHCYLESLCQ